jgi:hypothetical protein
MNRMIDYQIIWLRLQNTKKKAQIIHISYILPVQIINQRKHSGMCLTEDRGNNFVLALGFCLSVIRTLCTDKTSVVQVARNCSLLQFQNSL